ncbi:mate-domain-containing protein, partial [Coemansia spiralis]
MKASTYILMIVLPLHLLNTYLFVWSPVGFGFLGAAAANVVTFCAMFVGIIIYSWKSSARAAWGGWTRRSFAAMPQFYSLAIPSMIMVCSEWIGWELMAIASSYLGNVTLVAQSIVINTCTLTYQPVNGLRVAITNRIGNLLGQTRARRSKIASAVGICLGTVSGLVSLALYIIAANWWGRIYSTDLDVVAAVALAMPACGVFQLLDSVTSATSGIIRSIGRQTAGAWISIPSYYIIGLPLGLYLTYGRPAMGVLGLWIGLCIAIFITVSGQLLICLGVNYAEEVKRCLAQVSNSQNLANSESS